MASLRKIPLRFIFLNALLDCALIKIFHLRPNIGSLSPFLVYVGIFQLLWITQLVLFCLYAICIYPFYVSPLRHLYSPKGGKPLIGFGRELRKNGPGPMAREWFSETDSDALMRVLLPGNQEAIIIRSPQAISDVLVKNSMKYEKPEFVRQFLSHVIGWALLTTEGDVHKKQRRNMNPAFSFRHIKDLYPLFWRKSQEVVNVMTEECRQNFYGKDYVCMDISAWAVRSGLDIIGLAASGIDFGAIQNAGSPLANTYYKLNPSSEDLLLILLWALVPDSIMMKLPLSRITSVSEASKHLKEVATDLIRAKKIKMANKEDIGVDILSVALRAGLFSDDELVDQALTFLSAGHETTASALTWAVYMLCRFPSTQSRLREEIRAAIPSPENVDSSISSADIDNLPYLNAVCDEVLRLYGPVPATVRVNNCDTTIQGEFIPRDTMVIVPIWAINTDPLLWGPDAHDFKPERWLKPQGDGAVPAQSTSNYAFMTFLQGPHKCIGNTFARSEMACLLAAWVGRFAFELDDPTLMDERNIVIPPSVIAKPDGGLQMKVRVVDGW
ncbi:hypothetical protein LMH87_003269 [Akanthomyces muscarius]|uniref:Cytochrome P450 n=1 Tax=Akanthomyces muscarius TaxID=2231603 RepID=A0A9W8Q282_AKAMU|nr:hypothetical protein LMH87_003269 [Akanthomyces muscarius]KAJ4144385.1 hypothetical protein LMH87_003269 [Akanthomyces muscarius]